MSCHYCALNSLERQLTSFPHHPHRRHPRHRLFDVLARPGVVVGDVRPPGVGRIEAERAVNVAEGFGAEARQEIQSRWRRAALAHLGDVDGGAAVERFAVLGDADDLTVGVDDLGWCR